ncbi:hypothetical protein ACINB_47750 [Acidovorax sp. NB1]|nr:hypothetical protein ACINB_47750 [Acidovorax sp. NB1]
MLGHLAAQGAQGHAACRWHERVRREWGLGAVGRKLLPMGLGRAGTLRGWHVVGDNAQPMGGWAMRRHFRSVQIRRGYFAAVAVAGSRCPIEYRESLGLTA